MEPSRSAGRPGRDAIRGMSAAGAARSLMGRSYYPKANAAGLCQGTLETDDRQHAECPVMEPGQPGRATGRDSRPAARGQRRAGARRAAQARRPLPTDEQGKWRGRPAQVDAAEGLVTAQAITIGSMA